MKRAMLFLAMGSILAVVTLCVAATSSGPADDSSETEPLKKAITALEIEQLKKEIATLRERVESLEKRLKEQSIVIPHGRAVPPLTIDPNSLLQPRSTPRDWRRFEFNGMPYYVIPIQGAACPQPDPQK